MHYGLGGFGGFGSFGGLGMILFWIALVAVVIIVLKMFSGKSENKESNSGTPMDVLKRRYASGEIGRDEFEQKKRDLVGK